MNTIKKSLAVGATVALFGAPALFASAQTTDYSDSSSTNSYNTTSATGSTTGNTANTGSTTNSTGGTTGGTGTTNTTPGVPSTGVGPSQAAANAVLLGISAVTALVGGYFLTTGRKKVA